MRRRGRAPERPELSAPLANYVDLVRRSAVQLAVANAPKIALRLMLAHVIAGASRWRIEPERQQAASEANCHGLVRAAEPDRVHGRARSRAAIAWLEVSRTAR